MERDAVEQLRLVGGHQGRQARGLGGLGVVEVDGIGHRLQHRHLLQQRGQFFERAGGREAEPAQRIDRADERRAVGRRDRLDDANRVAAIDGAEHLAHALFMQRARAERDRLVGERECVAHRAPRSPREQAQRAGFGLDLLLREHVGEVQLHGLRRHRPQVELQAA